ncbi:hypothetical protein [Methylopila sp. M107]|uniref:hypothetical protein n=1 Tax=Methylopila sp. M107 TaxID=1101190 RepID=UPI000371E60C|nr:hypothetical protein [Methylopila sp. M107]
MTAISSTSGFAGDAAPAPNLAGPALLFAVIVAALTIQGDRLLADPDTHWHVRVGADIWRAKAVPWVDAYSHTFSGAPWIAKEWLSQLLMFGAHALGGEAGLVLAASLSVALTFALVFACLAARIRTTTALLLTLLALVLVTPHILARPHIFALLPLFFWTRGIVEAREADRTPSLWLLAVLAIWANLHNSFTIAYPIAGALALEALIAAPAEKRLEVALRWAGFGAAALLAGCVTPYGHHALAVTFTMFGSGESLPYIGEWDPIGWNWTAALALGSALLALVALAAGGVRNSVRILLVGALAAMMARHVRFLDVYAIVAPLVLVAPLVRRFPALRPETPDPASRWPLISTVGAVAAGLAAVVLTLGSTPRPSPLVTPQAALEAARRLGVSGPVYNSYDYGGFLIARGVPTFIDGRTDQLFLGGFISTLMGAIADRADAPFLDFVERHGATWAIAPTGGDEARHFDASPAWPRIYRDEVASVYVKR